MYSAKVWSQRQLQLSPQSCLLAHTQIAQLAHAETADVARTRFCDGGMLAERASIRANLLDRWQKQNWLVKDAVDRLWKG